MGNQLRSFGVTIGNGKTGPLNKITDVRGVKVGHMTVDTPEHKTGVTVILPCEDNPFTNKLTAAAYVHNGFGKTTGIVQIEELGTLETPIALTNTLNVGKVQDALVDYMLKLCGREGVKVTSINPVVGECNDSELNRIVERVIGREEVINAINTAGSDFEEGDVGAGKGTVCFGLKGGIGSSSREITIGRETYTIGVLVQSNFGATANLVIDHKPVGEMLTGEIEKAVEDRGSIMMIIATDLPVSDRQLKRMIKRAGVGLSRCGSLMGHGSGDIMIGFTTQNRIPMESPESVLSLKILKESCLAEAFSAVADATEEAILNSMASAKTVRGWSGKTRYSLADVYFKKIQQTD